MRSRAALMPFTKRIGDDSAKFSSAGAASCAKRLPANFEWRILTRSEVHTSELRSLMRISYAVFCLQRTREITIVHIGHPVTNAHIHRRLLLGNKHTLTTHRST